MTKEEANAKIIEKAKEIFKIYKDAYEGKNLYIGMVDRTFLTGTTTTCIFVNNSLEQLCCMDKDDRYDDKGAIKLTTGNFNTKE